MSSPTIRPAYSKWADYNRRLRDVVGQMTDDQLAQPVGLSAGTAR